MLIAARYSGAEVHVAENFQLGQTNAEPGFLEKFPLGKVSGCWSTIGECEIAARGCLCDSTLLGTCVSSQVPAFVTSDGRPISESNAIAFYGELTHNVM